MPDDEVPNHAFFPHIDGQWSGAIPKTANEVDDWHVPKTPHFGDRSANVLGVNGTPLFQNPDCTLSLGSFTCFAVVVLSDQSKFGYGNFAVLRGAHHHTAEFFRQQRDQGGVIGPEGGQVLFLVEIIEASGFNQQQSRLASLYLSSSPSGVRA